LGFVFLPDAPLSFGAMTMGHSVVCAAAAPSLSEFFRAGFLHAWNFR
jgi:hypothetical protein